MNTRDKILDRALEMFNERGIEYVGLRELAATLDIRVSNITYYFPTKDDLVFELSLGLSRKNGAIMVARDDISMKFFLEMMQQVFKNHLEFRCLLLSFVHVMEQNKRIASAYKKTQSVRNAMISSAINTMADNGYLELNDDQETEFLVSTLALISRFWISEATVSYPDLSRQEQVAQYLRLITRLLLPYCKPKGKKDIQQFMDQF